MRKVVTYLIISAAVFAAVVAFTVFRDDINSDTLDSFFSWFSRGGDPAGAVQIPFDGSRNTAAALVDGRLAILSPDRFVLYDKAGRERVSRAVSFELPSMTAAGSKVIVYDRGRNGVLISDADSVKAELDMPVLTASGNSRGQYILVTSESGYRSVAQVYDSRNRLTYKWYSADRYIMAVSISPSGRRMAVASAGQLGDSVSARITFLEPGNTEPLGTADIEGELPLAAFSPDNNHVSVLTESGVYFYSDTGIPLGQFRFGGMRLLSKHATDQALFLHIGRNEGGQGSRVVCLSYAGAELDSIFFSEGPDSLSAAGRWFASLEAGVLTRYSLDGTELAAEPLGLSQARDLLISPSGDILLLYPAYARWYNAPAANSA
jgi:hypothetical protein